MEAGTNVMRSKTTVSIKSGKRASSNQMEIIIIKLFFHLCSFPRKINLQRDLKILQEQGSAWPALTYDTQLDSL